MIQTIIFSKNRPAQLDLLLRSIKYRAPRLFSRIHIIYKATNSAFDQGYEVCDRDHPEAYFYNEVDLSLQVETMITLRHICFLVDDDLLVRQFIDTSPDRILDVNPDILCVSLRLGNNTNECYPLCRPQEHPPILWHINDYQVWKWDTADGDWGYPGSLDGHIFRRNELLDMVGGKDYRSPNELEEILVVACQRSSKTQMACYEASVLTGVPINRVNDTHPNRAGDFYPLEPEVLNATYLGGRRLSLDPLDRKDITAAHTELPLVFS